MPDLSPSDPKPKRSFLQKLFAISPAGLFKLLLACLGVGILLAVLNIDPRRVWFDFFGTISDAWAKGWELAGGAVDYLLLGAIIVVPVFLVMRLLQASGKK
ncbi:hypothetical protein MNBD_ALPHA06-896 [hydrothermal vent metagenome]|uniref:DUF6460 domain-containing protein n=1 Tax=hydrothermal vent metagenome TaxID=652676 RepID=A0A3B0R968_9ZZZZ